MYGLYINSDDRIEFKGRYNPTAVEKIKEVAGRRWNPTNKTWSVPKNPQNAKALSDLIDMIYPELAVHNEIEELSKNAGNFKLVSVTKANGGFNLNTPYKVDFVERIKDIDWHNRKWIKEQKAWFINENSIDQAISILKEFWHETDMELPEELFTRSEKLEKARTLAVATKTDETIELNGTKLYPFQVAGVHFLELMGRGIIADSMGLGKTSQFLATIARNEEWFPSLVVCPASVKMNWAKEIKKWIGFNNVSCDVVDGSKVYEINQNCKKGRMHGFFKEINENDFADIVIINYDVLQNNKDIIKKMGFNSVVFDESHYIKNDRSIRSKAAAEIAENIKHVVMLTGTPIMNRPIEIFFPLHILDKEYWPNKFSFGRKYCNAHKGRWGWDFTGSSNLDSLHKELIGKYMVRRRKKDVLKDMPDKVVYQTILEVPNIDRKEYDSARRNFIAWAKQQGGSVLRGALRAKTLAELTTLKRLAAESKIKAATEYIKEFFESNEDEQLVVFAHHRIVIEQLSAGLKKAKINTVRIMGGDSMDARQTSIEAFVKGDAQVFIGSIQAASTGIDGLQIASHMMFLERTWSPAQMLQGEDRIHRIGQEETCFIQYLDMENSIDEYMHDIVEIKKKIASQIVDGKVIEDNMVDNVLEKILNEVE